MWLVRDKLLALLWSRMRRWRVKDVGQNLRYSVCSVFQHLTQLSIWSDCFPGVDAVLTVSHFINVVGVSTGVKFHQNILPPIQPDMQFGNVYETVSKHLIKDQKGLRA